MKEEKTIFYPMQDVAMGKSKKSQEAFISCGRTLNHQFPELS
jgi:hypothetical protein